MNFSDHHSQYPEPSLSNLLPRQRTDTLLHSENGRDHLANPSNSSSPSVRPIQTFSNSPFDTLVTPAAIVVTDSSGAIGLPPHGTAHTDQSQDPQLPAALSHLPSSNTPTTQMEHFIVRDPNATVPPRRVVNPIQSVAQSLPIVVHHVPLEGVKKRAQSPLSLTLDLALPNEDLSAYDLVGSWPWLRLPPESSLQKMTKAGAKDAREAPPASVLMLAVDVKCSSNADLTANPCIDCLRREANRVKRNEQARLSRQKPSSSIVQDKSLDREGTPPVANCMVVFNSPEMVDFKQGRVELSLRVICYSRHHREPKGFRLIFRLIDSEKRVIGRGETGPILIYDDHSSERAKNAKASRSVSVPTSIIKNRRRRQTPSNDRTSDISLDSGLGGIPHLAANQESVLESTPLNGIINTASSSTLALPSTPSPSSSALPSSGYSTSSLESLMGTCFPNWSLDISMPPPIISDINPGSGPMLGGIKITVLGRNFTPQHRCVFGETVSAWTNFHSDSALTCSVPPGAKPGKVLVTFEGFPVVAGGGGAGTGDGQEFQWFEYIDDAEVELLKSLLRIASMRFPDPLGDSNDFAQRLVQNGTHSTANGVNFLSSDSLYTLQNLSTSDHTHNRANVEALFIELIDWVFGASTSDAENDSSDVISYKSSYGRTLLHTSAALGYSLLIGRLVSLGIDLDHRDVNGHTALHYASIYDHAPCVEVLVEAGAAMKIVDGHGHVAREIAFEHRHTSIGALLESLEGEIAESLDLCDHESNGEDEGSSSAAVPTEVTVPHIDSGVFQTSDSPSIEPKALVLDEESHGRQTKPAEKSTLRLSLSVSSDPVRRPVLKIPFNRFSSGALSGDLFENLFWHARILGEKGQLAEAIEADTRAVHYCRTVFEDNPTQHRANLAKVLDNLATDMLNGGDGSACLPIMEECTSQYRTLFDGNPVQYRRYLVHVLYAYGEALRRLGRYKDALQVSEEALELARGHSLDSTTDVRRALAETLIANAQCHISLEAHTTARAHLEEATLLWRSVVALRPYELPSLVTSLQMLAMQLRATDDIQSAFNLAEEAAVLNRQLFNRHPNSFRSSLANWLIQYAEMAAILKHSDIFLDVTEQAIRLLRETYGQSPMSTPDRLMTCLLLRAEHCQDVGRHRDAATHFEEGIPLLRAIVNANPSDSHYLVEFHKALLLYSISLSNCQHEADTLGSPVKRDIVMTKQDVEDAIQNLARENEQALKTTLDEIERDDDSKKAYAKLLQVEPLNVLANLKLNQPLE